MKIWEYWQAVLAQRPQAMRRFLDPEAVIRWPNTGEQFTAEEFVQVNCGYPGQWKGTLERVETLPGLVITVVHVYSQDRQTSCHVTSFLRLRGDRILALDEYWGDDGAPPAWRQAMRVGRRLSELPQE